MNRAALLAVVGAFAAARPAAAQTAAERTPIRIGMTISDSYTPCRYAQEAGLFEKAGLAVDIQRFTSGSAIGAALAGGSLDVGTGGILSVVLAYARGLSFSIIAPSTVYAVERPYIALITKIDSPIHAARDLVGKTVSTNGLNDMLALTIRSWVEQSGVDYATLHMTELPLSSIVTSLDAGRIDAGMAYEPVLSAAIESRKYRVLAHTYESVAKRLQDTAYYATANWIAAHRNDAAKFARVIHDANIYESAHENETIPLLAQFTGIDAATIKRMIRPVRPSFVDPADLQPVLDLVLKYKVISKPIAAHELISPFALRPAG